MSIKFLPILLALTLTACSPDKYILVRILDNDNCSPTSYSVVMNNLTVKVSGDQIERESTLVARNAEALIYFLPKYNGKDWHSYKIIAEYSDCETLISEEREAERGRIIYEWIEDRKIKHQIRS